MKRISMFVAGIGVLSLAFLAGTTPGADSDPYAALQLYDGKWEVKVNEPEKGSTK